MDDITVGLNLNSSQNHSTHFYGLLKANNEPKVTAAGSLLPTFATCLTTMV